VAAISILALVASIQVWLFAGGSINRGAGPDASEPGSREVGAAPSTNTDRSAEISGVKFTPMNEYSANVPRPPIQIKTNDPPTEAPSSPPDAPVAPRWFRTDHEDYQLILSHEVNKGFHPHILSGMFCHRQSLFACDALAYCPNGKGGDPFDGGPPQGDGGGDNQHQQTERAQWSPISYGKFFGWVQVGSIPETEGGTEENGFGKCLTWVEWGRLRDLGNLDDVEFENVWGEEYRRWILCCKG